MQHDQPRDSDDVLSDMQGLTNALAVVSEALNNASITDPHLSRLRSAVVGISSAMSIASGEVIAGAYGEATL